MTEALRDTREEHASAKSVERVTWGLLFIWVGAVLLLRWGWGVGLIGAGTIVVAAHGWRRHLGLALDRFGLLFGFMLLACGLWTLFEISIELVPVLCIAAGIWLLVSTRAASRAPPSGRPDVHATSHHRA